MRLIGVILAGGQARRMGGADKALALLGGQTLIARVADRFAPQVASLVISANGDPGRFAALGLPVLADAVPLGPLSGILSALDWAATQATDAVVSVPVDAPFLPGDLVPQLLLAAGDGPAIACTEGRDHAVFGLWPVGLRNDLRAFLASGVKPKVLDFCEKAGAARATFPNAVAFMNLNTAADLACAEAMVGGSA